MLGLRISIFSRPHQCSPLARIVEHAERDYIFNVLELTGWNRMRAAETLGISRKNLWEKIKLHRLAR